MSTTSKLGLGAAALLALGGITAFTLNRTAGAHRAEAAPVERSSFSAMIHGAVTALPDGAARFGTVGDGGGAPAAFSLTLGVGDREGAILFTGPAGGRLEPGSYTVSDDGEQAGAVRALIVTGPIEHPTGTFRGHAGTLTVTRTTDSTVSGCFELRAMGFLADDPADETRTMMATGSFAATR